MELSELKAVHTIKAVRLPQSKIQAIADKMEWINHMVVSLQTCGFNIQSEVTMEGIKVGFYYGTGEDTEIGGLCDISFWRNENFEETMAALCIVGGELSNKLEDITK
tara:strand:- start:4973 stop:5293 length:321 start_codon:yes stop_codon:yes gene_type:complete